MAQLSNDMFETLSDDEKTSLVVFRRQYMQRLNIKELHFPLNALLAQWDVQEWLWHAVDFVQHYHSYPSYDKAFLKTLQLKLEQAVESVAEPDIVDSFAELYTNLLKQPDLGDHYVWVRYTPPWQPIDAADIESGIDLLEKPSVLSASGCTGHRTWEAALHLASLLNQPWMCENIIGKNVLELGSGTGLISMTCHELGAKHVRATDGDAGGVARLGRTIDRNSYAGSKSRGSEYTAPIDTGIVRCQNFLWGCDLDQLGEKAVDTVLAADVTYDNAGIPDLVMTLRDVLRKHSMAYVVISATVRNHETFQYFLNRCHTGGLLASDPGNNLSSQKPAMGFFHSTSTTIRLVQISLSGGERPG